MANKYYCTEELYILSSRLYRDSKSCDSIFNV